MATPVIFYDWPYSPFCMKVRAILRCKQVDFTAVSPLGAPRADIRRRGRIGKVPAIELDGVMIADSTDIAYALEARFPEPSIIPDEDRRRGLCHALEEWADESLYFLGLYYRWFEAEGRKPIAAVFGSSIKGRLAYRFYLQRILGQIRGQGTLRKPPDHVHRDLVRQLDAIESLVAQNDYLLGKRPFLCDFALWGQLTYLRRTPVGGAAMAGRTATAAYLERFAAMAA
jgi:glutathione S-transferase